MKTLQTLEASNLQHKISMMEVCSRNPCRDFCRALFLFFVIKNEISATGFVINVWLQLYNLFLHFIIHTAWLWQLCAAETCSWHWTCYNKVCFDGLRPYYSTIFSPFTMA